MKRTAHDRSNHLKTPLLSSEWLKYLGLVAAVLILYVLGIFYYHYADDIFPKALSFGQRIRLALLSLGSQLHFVIFALFFFSSALLYHSVRKQWLNPLKTVRRDLVVIIPLGILLWVFGAFYDAPVKGRFYAMIFETQQLEPGQKLDNNMITSYELMVSPDLSGMYDKVDTLEVQIEEAEQRFIDQLAVLTPPSKLEEFMKKIDFGSSSIQLEDIQNSSYNWDTVDRDFDFFESQVRSRRHYIDALTGQQDMVQSEINIIHLTPIYILLFMLFGMLIGYLIPIHKAALTAILFAIGYGWYFCAGLIETPYMTYMNKWWFVLGKIGVLVLLNATLLILARRAYLKSIASHG